MTAQQGGCAVAAVGLSQEMGDLRGQWPIISKLAHQGVGFPEYAHLTYIREVRGFPREW